MNLNSSQPNLIGVGAARAGTTSLYHWLNSHPQVFMSPIKETNYFARSELSFNGPGDFEVFNRPVEKNPNGRFYQRHAALINTWDRYIRLFSPAKGFSIRGEISPAYLYYPTTAERIKEKLPNCKIIILLRDPIERAFSNYKALVKAGREYLDFESALEIEEKRMEEGYEFFWALKGLGLYYSQVERYLDLFSKEKVGIWLYANIRDEPAHFYHEVCRFLGVGDCFTPKFSKYNKSESQVGMLQHFMAKHRSIKTFSKKLLPGLVRSIVKLGLNTVDNTFLKKSLYMKSTTREKLLEYYHDDIIRLQGLLPELNVMRWIDKHQQLIEDR